MTRKTRIFKIDYEGLEVLYRTLTMLELEQLRTLENSPAHRLELAAKMSILDDSYEKIPYPLKQFIGSDIIEKSELIIRDDTLFKISVKNIRESIKSNYVLSNIIPFIVNVLPNTNIEYLLNQTYEDIIELACLCESLSNKYLFNVEDNRSNKSNLENTTTTSLPIATGRGLVRNKDGKLEFEDDGVPLSQKIKDNQKFYNDVL